MSEDAIEQLARNLNFAQHRLDPDGFSDWEEYDERDREFFRSSIRALMLDRELWEMAWAA